MHKPLNELADSLAEAGKEIRIGASYSHYKNPEQLYKVSRLAITEATNEPCVVYQALYGPRITFVRPVSSWLETVEVEGKTLPRFLLVE